MPYSHKLRAVCLGAALASARMLGAGTLLDFDVTPRLHEIDVPVLFITGEFDEARPETVAGFQRLIEGARFEVVKDAGHATLSKKPEQYRALLEAFLDSAERARMAH